MNNTWVTRAVMVVACSGMPAALLAAPVQIYRCAGTPVIYTTEPRLAASGRCEPVGASPPAAPRARFADMPDPSRKPAAPSGAVTVSTDRTTVPREVQQQRDADRVRILQDELARERARVAQLTSRLREAADTPGETTSVAELEQALQRSQADIVALTRELAAAGGR
jgi:hypothetical protein